MNISFFRQPGQLAPMPAGGGRKPLRRRMARALEAAQVHKTLRLETGTKQTEAIALYERLGYRRIPAFGEYVSDPCSVCYKKDLSAKKRSEYFLGE